MEQQAPQYIKQGDDDVIWINTKDIWDNWQSSQKLENLKEKRIAYQTESLTTGRAIDPIIFEKLIYEETGGVFIRTSDGRHRLEAAKRLNVTYVPVLNNQAAQEAIELLSLRKQ